MCSAEDFDADEEEVVVRSLRGGDYYDLLRMMAWMMMVSKIPGVKATGIYNKKPLDYDGSVEFYVLLLVGGIALLAVWEALKWVMQRCFGEDEATVAKARRLLRIRNQASKALQQELESMSASSSDPINVEKPVVSTPKLAATPLSEVSQGPMSEAMRTTRTSTRAPEDDPDLRAALDNAREGGFQRLRTSFVMSEHGDRLHLVADCHGLRHANKSRLRKMQVCYYCDGNFPLSYKVLQGRTIPEGR